MEHESLKEMHQEARDNCSDDFNLRIHRSLSWLKEGEKLLSGPDGNSQLDSIFIYYWISFNSAYGREKLEGGPMTVRDSNEIYYFLKRLVRNDAKDRLYAMMWSDFSQSIRVITENNYLSVWFWKHQEGKISKTEFETKTAESKRGLLKAMGNMNTPRVLLFVLERLRLLRNQIFHGSSTYGGRVNREQVELGTKFMQRFVPLTIEIMLEQSKEDWGAVKFPVVNNPQANTRASSRRKG